MMLLLYCEHHFKNGRLQLLGYYMYHKWLVKLFSDILICVFIMSECFINSLTECFHVNIIETSLYNYLVRPKFNTYYSSVPVASSPLQSPLAWHQCHDGGDDGGASFSQQQLQLRVWAYTWRL